MEFAKAACRKGADSVGLLREHLTRLDPRENHILLRAMVVVYWQSIAQVAEQHRKQLIFTPSPRLYPRMNGNPRSTAPTPT
jgi:hypothetical protein